MHDRTVRSLAAAVPNARLYGSPDTAVTGIEYDSRAVTPGALFAALRGSDRDGHAFLGAAVQKGASCVLVEEQADLDVPQIVVTGSSRSALAKIACAFFGHPSRELTVIGITGTDGKTTTTAMVRSILTGTGHQAGSIGTVGIEIGDGSRHDLGHQTTPESNVVQKHLREMSDAGTTHAVIEATSHGLATHRLDGVRFLAGGVTNITHEHLEFHKTIENYRRAKATLLERVGQEVGVVVINNDDEGARWVAPFADGGTCVTYSASGADADLRARATEHVGTGVSFDVVDRDGVSMPVRLPMPGQFNVANALCALGLAGAVGIGLGDAAQALSSARPVPGRMQPIDVGQPFRVVVDYAHTPESIRMILGHLRHQHPLGQLIVVTGSAGERDVEKRPLQGAACAQIADLTIVTSEDPRNEDPEEINEQIVSGAEQAGAVRGVSVLAITDRREAIHRALQLAAPGDCVLLAGKGHETSIIWGHEHVPWDEAAVAEELLRDMVGREGHWET
jgi:UDP-N-acetylmuramoyl-L-alanyl-D-glutamate--2,6-diaminopimelate ligase